MPLMKKKSKAAFEHNIKAEMEAGKPQKQSLAIAYSVKRKAKKAMGGKMYAEGGSIKDEKRPMPDQEHNDKAEAQRNSGDKAPGQDSWTSRPDIKQSQKGKTSPLKHPKMVPQSAYSVRLRDQEDDLEMSAAPASDKEQPPREDDEMGADRQGPKVPDMQKQHDNGRKAYAKGGMINDEVSMKDAEEDMAEHPAGLESDDDQMSPPEGEFMAGHFADGGMVDNEEELEHAASIAAAIMMKMRKKMAEGGPINGEDSIYAHPDEDQADLSRNAEEDANMEDQSSFDALRKENYSESEGLEALDQPHDSNLHGDPHEDDEENIHDGDIVSAIRSKMKRKSAITR